MVKSHRSTLTLFHQWPQSPSDINSPTTSTPHTPGSPSQLDPFSNSSTLPEPLPSRSRPHSTVISQSANSSSGGTTPKIILASPSTSTIHYLFPSTETRSHLSLSAKPPNVDSTNAQPSRHMSLRHRPSQHQRVFYHPSGGDSSTNRKSQVGSSLPPSRSTDSVRNVLGPSKRVVSGSSGLSGAYQTNIGRSPSRVYPHSMRTLRRQPSMADLGKGRGLHVEVEPRGNDILEEIRNIQPEELISPKTTGPTPIYLRRRSQSLTSPSSSPVSEQPSPILPAPDFGDPLSFADVLPSPSFSHLDYSTAGSSAPSRRNSTVIAQFLKTASAVYPSSVPMSRGSTRVGLGSYDSGKIRAREDAVRRLNGEGTVRSRMEALRRSVSMRKKDEVKKSRPRSQSFSSRSVREMGISPPVPPMNPNRHTTRVPPDPARGIYLGDHSVDMGGRYAPPASSPYSPISSDTSLYPESTPSSGFASLPGDNCNVTVASRPLLPAFTSEASLLARSTLGLGFSPVSDPLSLPASLEAEVIDLTERGRKLPAVKSEPVPPLSDSSSRMRKSTLLAQNTFFLPPPHAKPALRSTKSMGPDQMRRAFTSANLQEEGKSHSVVSRESKIGLKEGTERLTSPITPTIKARRPITTFSLCSPPGAIEPLPSMHAPETEHPQSRSNRSSPFLTASSSLRVVFGKGGFVARSLSSAFDRETKHEEPLRPDLKDKISAPLSATQSQQVKEEQEWRRSILGQALSQSLSSGLNHIADGSARLVSSSSKPRLGIPEQLLSAALVVEKQDKTSDRMMSKRISATSLQREREYSPSDDGLETLAGLGETMLRRGPIYSIESGLNLRAGGEHHFTVPSDAPAMPSDRSVSHITASAIRRHVRVGTPSPTPGVTSRWSPSPVKKGKKVKPGTSRPIISDPLPLSTPADPSRLGLSALEPHRSPPVPTEEVTISPEVQDVRSASARSKLFGLVRREKTIKATTQLHRASAISPPSLTSPSTFSVCQLRSPVSPSSNMKPSISYLHQNLQPISSESLNTTPNLLEELAARDQNAYPEGDKEWGRTEKVEKVLNWRDGVGDNDEIRRLDEKLRHHMEYEKEWIRGVAERESPKKKSGEREVKTRALRI